MPKTPFDTFPDGTQELLRNNFTVVSHIVATRDIEVEHVEARSAEQAAEIVKERRRGYVLGRKVLLVLPGHLQPLYQGQIA